MTAQTAAPFEHPLRSRKEAPRSDVQRATATLADAVNELLNQDAPAGGGATTDALAVDTPAKERFVAELLRCVGGRVEVTGVGVGDLVLQVTCADEAGAASIAAAVSHTGVGGKASWFKAEDDKHWVVLVIPNR